MNFFFGAPVSLCIVIAKIIAVTLVVGVSTNRADSLKLKFMPLSRLHISRNLFPHIKNKTAFLLH